MRSLDFWDAQKGFNFTRPPQARQDAPLPEQGRREALTAGVALRYVED
jgi:hypothetical protein